MDSLVHALMRKRDDCLLLHFDTGAQDAEISKSCAHQLAIELNLELLVMNARDIFGVVVGGENYIPRRNIIMAIIAATYGKRVYIGGIKGDVSHDKTYEIFEATRRLINASGNSAEKVNFCNSLLWDIDKLEVARVVHDYSPELLQKTWGCYTAGPVHCGDCIACFRRYVVMQSVGEECEFAIDPMTGKGEAYYRDQIVNNKYRENIPLSRMRSVLNL